jgi:hypothetical protein
MLTFCPGRSPRQRICLSIQLGCMNVLVTSKRLHLRLDLLGHSILVTLLERKGDGDVGRITRTSYHK